MQLYEVLARAHTIYANAFRSLPRATKHEHIRGGGVNFNIWQGRGQRLWRHQHKNHCVAQQHFQRVAWRSVRPIAHPLLSNPVDVDRDTALMNETPKQALQALHSPPREDVLDVYKLKTKPELIHYYHAPYVAVAICFISYRICWSESKWFKLNMSYKKYT